MISPGMFSVDLEQVITVGQDELSIGRLGAAMMFPNDSDLRRQYLGALELANRTGIGAEIFQAGLMDRLDRVNNGILAGMCLIYFEALHEGNYRTKAGNKLEASQNAVLFLADQWNLGRHRRMAKNKEAYNYPTVTTQHAKDVWKDYQRVSHLWAAYVQLMGQTATAQSDGEIFFEIDISVLMFLSRQHERFVKEFFDGSKVGGL